MDYEGFFSERLDALHAEGRYRVFADLERRCGRFPRAFDHRIGAEVTVWCSNDYLGMGQHPAVLAAMEEALQASAPAPAAPATSPATAMSICCSNKSSPICTARGGARSSPPAMSPTTPPCRRWRANCRAWSYFPTRSNHASMIAGIRNSRAEKHVFRHNDPADLARLIARVTPGRPKLVCFESVYSMDGDIAPIGELCDVAERYGAMTYLDEVHAVGLYGAARRRHCRARRGHAPPERDPGNARQGVWHRSAAISRARPRSSILCAATPRASSSRPRCRRRSPPARSPRSAI